jgi:hypothetical protein
MHYDFNILENKARSLIESGQYSNALRIYLFMADGDMSLDGGYLGMKIAECYENLKDFPAAKYWYGRAIEENPKVRTNCIEARKRLENININDLVAPHEYIIKE